MASPKGKTIQQRFGFVDQDLKKPKHDEILYWLEHNLKDCLSQWIGFSEKWKDHQVEELTSRVRSLQERRLTELSKELAKVLQSDGSNEPTAQFLQPKKPWEEIKPERVKGVEASIESVKAWTAFPPLPEKPPIGEIATRWEEPITTTRNSSEGNKYVVGFIDFTVRCKIPSLDLRGIWEDNLHDSWRPEWRITFPKLTFRFEVKTEIPSLGEVIRQINMYREYDSNAEYYLVSPDDKHVDVLKKERIGFVRYAQ